MRDEDIRKPQRATGQGNPFRPFKPYKNTPVTPVEHIGEAVRAGAVTALREAALRDDSEHVSRIRAGGVEYVRAWLNSIADDIENRVYESEADGNYVRDGQ